MLMLSAHCATLCATSDFWLLSVATSRVRSSGSSFDAGVLHAGVLHAGVLHAVPETHRGAGAISHFNLLLTPHIGGQTGQALLNMGGTVWSLERHPVRARRAATSSSGRRGEALNQRPQNASSWA